MSLLPTIILCCTDGPRSGKQINWPPTYWVFLITLFRLQCIAVPHLRVYMFPSLFLIRRPCSRKPRSIRPYGSLHSLSMSMSWDQGLPLPSFWGLTTTTSWSCPFWLFIQVMPIRIFPHFCLQMSSNLPTPQRVSPILPALPSHHSFSLFTFFQVTHKSLPFSPTTSVPRKTLILSWP